MKLEEKFAILAHSQWAGWMKYLFGKSKKNSDGSVTIPKELVDRWERQMESSYENLSEPEKDSDRTEAKKFIDVIKTHMKKKMEKMV